MSQRIKKLLIISGAINYGAPGKIVEQTGLLAKENGYDVLVAHSSRNEGLSKLPHFPVTSKWEEYVHALGAKLFDLHGLLSNKATRELIDKIEKYAPDVIHLHNIHGYFLNFKILFEYLGKIDIPVVWTLHDCWAFTGRCFHFEHIGCNKWQNYCYACKAEAGYTVSSICDKSSQLFKLKKELFTSVPNLTLVPVSYWLENHVKKSFLKDKRIEVIQNGIDLKVFTPLDGNKLREKYGFVDKFVLLGVAAPFNKRKGLDDFIKLHQILPSDFVIVLIGLSPTQIKALPNGIIGLTRTNSQRDLAEFYSMADIFCNLTYQDTFPTVNLEALACGTPVFTYHTGGSPETIDKSTGIVVDTGDVEMLAEALIQYKNNPFISAQDCRKRAESYFNKDKQLMEYINLYNKLLINQ